MSDNYDNTLEKCYLECGWYFIRNSHITNYSGKTSHNPAIVYLRPELFKFLLMNEHEKVLLLVNDPSKITTKIESVEFSTYGGHQSDKKWLIKPMVFFKSHDSSMMFRLTF